MKKEYKKFSTLITEKHHAKLKKIEQETGTAMYRLINRALELLFKNKKK